ncbi:hypothetical protein J6590_051396 [Homalodisca vitripennis]|nr:hypothetical protein J6590_051396 [Homalodisca vitripennis]
MYYLERYFSFSLEVRGGATEACTDDQGHFRSVLSQPRVTCQTVQRDLTSEKDDHVRTLVKLTLTLRNKTQFETTLRTSHRSLNVASRGRPLIWHESLWLCDKTIVRKLNLGGGTARVRGSRYALSLTLGSVATEGSNSQETETTTQNSESTMSQCHLEELTSCGGGIPTATPNHPRFVISTENKASKTRVQNFSPHCGTPRCEYENVNSVELSFELNT